VVVLYVPPTDNIWYVRFGVFTAVTMKNAVFWYVRSVALVRTEVSEELSASIIRVTRIGELGTSNKQTAHAAKKGFQKTAFLSIWYIFKYYLLLGGTR
jgi:hypothetical protein